MGINMEVTSFWGVEGTLLQLYWLPNSNEERRLLKTWKIVTWQFFPSILSIRIVSLTCSKGRIPSTVIEEKRLLLKAHVSLQLFCSLASSCYREFYLFLTRTKLLILLFMSLGIQKYSSASEMVNTAYIISRKDLSRYDIFLRHLFSGVSFWLTK